MRLNSKNILAVLWLAVSFAFVGCSAEGDSKPAGEKKSSSKKIDITGKVFDLNTATAEELEALPNVGAVLAKRMIDARPYTSLDDLQKVEGIGEKTFQEIKPHLEVK